MIDSPYLIDPGKKFKLSDLKADDTGDFKHKKEALALEQKNLDKLAALQDKLYAQDKRGVLIVLQAMDGGGKDGTISHVFSGVNPQGCAVSSFKQPTKLELAHDYLWRIHLAAPPKGMIGIFNRSHYESVLVERVKKLVPEDVWSRRYEQINNFERLLADEGTLILKFFLNISWEEQKRRMEKRLADPRKNWKFDPEDLKNRERWTDYMAAYEDALRKCSTRQAPWYAVPADHKWFRNWVISDIIVRALEKLDLKYPPPLEGAADIRVK
ncbi:MAG TPA: polyphosphate kinase 2 family protein [Tepidisphaeraceae bacterium]|nr:polyphosphate kinase 2 family protein [Tepidisphaeraceae bacterium]